MAKLLEGRKSGELRPLHGREKGKFVDGLLWKRENVSIALRAMGGRKANEPMPPFAKGKRKTAILAADLVGGEKSSA